MSMNTVSLIREAMKTAHEWFEGTMADVTPEMAHYQPGGTAHPIGSRYAHALVGEDTLINGMIKGGAPMYATSWAGKTGISDTQPAFSSPLEWAQTVKVDLGAARNYAQAVYANTDAYLATLKDEDLTRTLDLSAMNMGQWSLGSFLISFTVGHIRDIMGEVSAIKGAQGAKGYPF
ncbi:MAG: DinB family protein [Chloroflexi bacterium]|nr:DinB family protein [Chloroflexota bacterium]